MGSVDDMQNLTDDEKKMLSMDLNKDEDGEVRADLLEVHSDAFQKIVLDYIDKASEQKAGDGMDSFAKNTLIAMKHFAAYAHTPKRADIHYQSYLNKTTIKNKNMS